MNREIVISASDQFLEQLKAVDDRTLSRAQLMTAFRGFKAMIQNGIELPLDYGDLIDKSELKVGPVFNERGECTGYMYVTENELNSANVIVPGKRNKIGKEQ